MDTIHIKSIEKYHPGYKDRKLHWAKIYFDMVSGEPEFEMIDNEIDKWRFVAMICLELNAQQPLPNDDKYWKKYFNTKIRPMSLTLQMLHNYLDTVTQLSKESVIDKSKITVREEIYTQEQDKTSVTKQKVDEVVNKWNCFASLETRIKGISKVSSSRLGKLTLRLKDSLFDIDKLIEAIKDQPFLLGEGATGWVVSFDWLILNDTNYLKVLEKKYLKAKTEKEKEDELDRRLFAK